MSSKYSNATYFAADTAEKTATYLQQKGDEWFNVVYRNNYIDKVRRSWGAYHGAYYNTGHNITYGGEQGEIVNLAVNHYRNLARWLLNFVTSSRPAFQARSINTDYKSQSQVYLANGLLDYYMREERLEEYLVTAVEYAIVLGAGYIKMTWNSTSGKIYDYIESSERYEQDEIDPSEAETLESDDEGKPIKFKRFPIYEGNVEFVNLSPFDVVFDSSKETPMQHDWMLCRSFKNKYDLIAKYPEFKDKIIGIPTKTEQERRRVTLSIYDETCDVPLYEFFHKKTDCLPDGRYMLYLDSDTVLEDSIMPYRNLPIYRMSPSNILGTSFGYTDMFDLLPLQDFLNSAYSTVATNHNAFGVQNVISPRGADITNLQVAGGLNFIEYNKDFGKPEALNLTYTPPEIFNFIEKLERNMETISGINSVARGNPEASLKSGTALALVQSQALQFSTNLQRSYIRMIEDAGTGLINLLKDFAAVPRIAAITGVNNQTKMKEFKGSDLETINRVIVDAGNALSNTPAGKMQMAEQLIQMFPDKMSPQQYFSVMQTGKLEVMTDSVVNQNMLIKAENERLVSGDIQVIATAVENHLTHIQEHSAVLFDPDLKLDPALNARVLAHIQEHINMLRTVDPSLLAILGQQALGPAAGTPNAPQNMQNAPVPAGAMGTNPEIMSSQEINAANPSAMMPAMPNPAQSPDGNPTMPGQKPLVSGS